jgi:ADP-ribosyl-[dinitrogen reductase] hydrolase
MSILDGKVPPELVDFKKLVSPAGHISSTFNNAVTHFAKTDSFEDCIIQAVNNGGDADTIAAISGSMAGAFYGYSSIP